MNSQVHIGEVISTMRKLAELRDEEMVITNRISFRANGMSRTIDVIENMVYKDDFTYILEIFTLASEDNVP